MQAREVQFGHGGGAFLRRAELFLLVGPVTRETGVQQENRALRDFAMLFLPPLQIRHADLVIGIQPRSSENVHDHRRTDELVGRELIHGSVALGEMDGRVEVRAAMLGGAVTIGAIEGAFLGLAMK